MTQIINKYNQLPQLEIEDINLLRGLIPTETNSTNKLADKNFVNNVVTTMTARYITMNSSGSIFSTYANLINATNYYFNGTTTTPTENDYSYVLADETENGAQTRYIYTGTQWSLQIIVNNTPFTQSQNDAIDSGVSATWKTDVDTSLTNKADKTSDFVTPITNSNKGISITEITTHAAVPATTTSLGHVKIGSGLAIGVDGTLINTGIQTNYHWKSTELIVGNTGTIAHVKTANLVCMDGTATYPDIGDTIICGNSTQVLVTVLHSGGELDDDEVQGFIIVSPPASASWDTIGGQMLNNQIIPAIKTDGISTVSIARVDTTNTLQIGDITTPIDLKSPSNTRVTNNGETLAYQSDLNTITGGSNVSIADIITAYQSADSNLNTLISQEAGLRTNGDTNTLSSANTYTDQAIINSGMATAKWLESVSTYNNLLLPPTISQEQTYLCNVTTAITDYPIATYQWIGDSSTTSWSFFGDSSNYITPSYLDTHGYTTAQNGTVINNLTTDDYSKALSASMGKYLNDTKLTATDVIDNLISTDTNNPLSANQGKILNDKTTTLQSYFTNSKANQAITTDTASTAIKLTTPRTFTVNITGAVTGTGTAAFDGSGNPTISIITINGDLSSQDSIMSAGLYQGLYGGCCINWCPDTGGSVVIKKMAAGVGGAISIKGIGGIVCICPPEITSSKYLTLNLSVFNNGSIIENHPGSSSPPITCTTDGMLFDDNRVVIIRQLPGLSNAIANYTLYQGIYSSIPSFGSSATSRMYYDYNIMTYDGGILKIGGNKINCQPMAVGATLTWTGSDIL